jgi:tetratricopeptide (TPR) repeat protein
LKPSPHVKRGDYSVSFPMNATSSFICIVFFLVGIIFPFPILASSSSRALLQKALDTDSPLARVAILNRALRTASADAKLLASIHFELGLANKELKHYRKAIKEFDLSREHSTNSVESLLEKAHCLILLNRLNRASNVLEQILSTKHGIARAYVLKAQIYEKQGFFSKAEDELTRALHYNPHSPLALQMRAKLLMGAGKPKQALKDVNNLVRMARHNPKVFLMRARILVSLRNYSRALHDYEMAEKLALQPEEIVKEKVLVFFKMGQPKKVLETLATRLNKGTEGVDVLILRARAYIGLKSYSAAERMLHRVLQNQPSHAQANLYIGVAAMRQSKLDAALAYFNRAIELDASLTAAYKERARTFAELEEYVRAIKDLNHAAHVDPSDGDIFALRGSFYVHRKLYDAAIEDFTRALDRTPSDPKILYARAYAYWEKEDLDSALSDLDMLIQTHPHSCQALGLLGVIHLKQGSIQRAEADFDEAVKCDPKNSIFYNNRGYFYYKTGAYDMALANFKQSLDINPAYNIARYNLQFVKRKQKTEEKSPPAVFGTVDRTDESQESHIER